MPLPIILGPIGARGSNGVEATLVAGSDRPRGGLRAAGPSSGHLNDLAHWQEFVSAEGASPVNALFIATETAPRREDVSAFAEHLITGGMFWLSSWGADCEWVHDLFDEVDVWFTVQLHERGTNTDGVVITTWHDKETLGEALEFFWTAAFPDEGKSYGPNFVALAVGSEAFRAEVEQAARTLPAP